MRSDVAPFPDAEKCVIDFLMPLLAEYDDSVRIDVRGGAGRFVRVRRVGGVMLTPNHDAPRIDVLIWHDSDKSRMQLAQQVWAWLRAADGDIANGAALLYASTTLGPRQMPDPADDTKTVAMLTVDLIVRRA
jgi:hypothetical protein